MRICFEYIENGSQCSSSTRRKQRRKLSNCYMNAIFVSRTAPSIEAGPQLTCPGVIKYVSCYKSGNSFHLHPRQHPLLQPGQPQIFKGGRSPQPPRPSRGLRMSSVLCRRSPGPRRPVGQERAARRAIKGTPLSKTPLADAATDMARLRRHQALPMHMGDRRRWRTT